MLARFHPTLPWTVRLGLAARLGWVWATVPRLPAPPEPAGIVGGRPPGLSVLGIGDSIIAGIGVGAQTEGLVARVAIELARGGREVRWQSAGAAGAMAATLVAVSDVPVARPPDLLLLSCGVNDVVRGVRASDFGASLIAFYRSARSRWPGASIVHAGIPPLESFPALSGRLGRVLGEHGASCIAAARGAAIGSGAIYADFPRDVDASQFARDGFHPNSAGCAAWAVAVARALNERGAPRVSGAGIATG